MGARYKNLCGFLIVIAIIVVLLSYYYQKDYTKYKTPNL